MIKYTIPMRDDFDLLWRADIDIPGYSGESIQLTGVGRAAMVPEWNGDIDEPFSPIINSKVTLQFYNEGNVDIVELQNLQDMAARVYIYRDNVLWWTGYVIPDGIQRNFRAYPYPVQLVATDGLALLTDIPFQGVNNWPLPVGISNRSPLAFVRYVLFNAANLNCPLPIRWASSIESVEYEDDFFAGTMEWGALGEAWNNTSDTGDGLNQTRSCMYILENMVKSMGARIFQSGGKWHIMRINDIVGGVYNWKEIDTTYGPGTPPAISSGTEDLVAGLNGVYYPFITENHIITMKPALTDVVATYEQYQAENIVPNGGFELSSLSPMYWVFFTNPDGRASIALYEDSETHEKLSLTGQPGQSMVASYPLDADDPMEQDAEFTYSGGLPIDANILFKRFTFGFTILPLKGFPFFVSGENEGQIDWSNNPLRIKMLYMCDDGMGNSRAYYLNEYGYWQYHPVGGYLYIKSFNAVEAGGNTTFTYVFEGNPMVGNTININYTTALAPFPIEHALEVNSSTAGDLLATINLLADMIEIDSFWNTTVTPSGANEVQLIAVVNSTAVEDGGHTVGSGKDTILSDLSLPLTVPNMKMGDIASVQFQGRGGNSEILLPNPGVLDGSQLPTIGKLYLWFYLKEGQSYVLDDVYIRVESNSDVYQSLNNATTRKSNRQNVSVGISTSFNGFFLSNFMTSYNKSNEEFTVTDGKHTSSLTGLLANAMMRFRHKPSQIFNGTIYTNDREWQFHHMYLISALGSGLFMPLQSRYNIETCQVTLAIIEARDDENTFDEKHYASNEVLV